jgi:hypothetical protein
MAGRTGWRRGRRLQQLEVPSGELGPDRVTDALAQLERVLEELLGGAEFVPAERQGALLV